MPSLVNGDLGQEKQGAFTLQELQKLYHQQLLLQMQEAETARVELTRVRDQLKNEEAARAHAQVQDLLAELMILVINGPLPKLDRSFFPKYQFAGHILRKIFCLKRTKIIF